MFATDHTTRLASAAITAAAMAHELQMDPRYSDLIVQEARLENARHETRERLVALRAEEEHPDVLQSPTR